MSIDLAKIPSHLIDATGNGKLVLFIGAGVSKQAESKESDILPNWPELIREIISVAAYQGMSENDEAVIERLIQEGKYLIAAQALKDHIESSLFESFMRRRFQRNIKPGCIHRALFKLGTPLILTTNYDLLLEQAHAEVFNTPARVATPERPEEIFRSLKAPWKRDSPVIFKLHGTILEPMSIVLGERDYYNLVYRPHYRLVLRTIFMTRIVLMLGFSFSDPDITEAMATGLRGDFIVLPKGKTEPFEKRRLRNFGVEVIEYEASEGHAELLELVEYLAGFVRRTIEISPHTCASLPSGNLRR